MKFEILLEETSFVKKKIEAENVGLAEAVDDFMRDKDEAVITKKWLLFYFHFVELLILFVWTVCSRALLNSVNKRYMNDLIKLDKKSKIIILPCIELTS